MKIQDLYSEKTAILFQRHQSLHDFALSFLKDVLIEVPAFNEQMSVTALLEDYTTCQTVLKFEQERRAKLEAMTPEQIEQAAKEAAANKTTVYERDYDEEVARIGRFRYMRLWIAGWHASSPELKKMKDVMLEYLGNSYQNIDLPQSPPVFAPSEDYQKEQLEQCANRIELYLERIANLREPYNRAKQLVEELKSSLEIHESLVEASIELGYVDQSTPEIKGDVENLLESLRIAKTCFETCFDDASVQSRRNALLYSTMSANTLAHGGPPLGYAAGEVEKACKAALRFLDNVSSEPSKEPP